MSQTIDVTGLPPEAIRAVESLVGLLRARPDAAPAASAEEWIKALREWASSHPRQTHYVDDSREAIYGGRGE